MLKDDFGRSALNLAKEILEKEEKDRTEAEINFLCNIDKVLTENEKIVRDRKRKRSSS